MSLLLLAARLIDGTGADPISNVAVRVDGDRITRVERQSELLPSHRAGADVVDLGDATLLPGLIDTHVHTTFNASQSHDEVRAELEDASDSWLAVRAIANAQAHLAAGVTSIRDVGGRGFVTLAVRDALRAGLVPGPRMQASGPALTRSRGHLFYLRGVAESLSELRSRAREALDAGADLVKICVTGGIMTRESDPMESQYSVEELRGVVEEAEQRGTLVAAHSLSREGLHRCVAAGVRSIEHCFWQHQLGQFEFEPEVAREMKSKGMVAGLTFAGIAQQRYLQQVHGRAPSEGLGPWLPRLEQRYVSERAMIDAGVRFVLHSDAGVRETPFGDFWLIPASAAFELKLTAAEAIHAVSLSSAALMGIDGEVGAVTPGRKADLLAVAGDAAVDLAALRAPLRVWRDGREVARDGRLIYPAA